jgi:DNA polymerase-3 subunit delta'
LLTQKPDLVLMSDFPSLPYPWQQTEWQQFCDQIAAKKTPHALMLAGPKGIGKRHMADAMAQVMLCQNPIEGTPCSKCRGCQLLQAQTHPDMLVLEPEEGSKAIKVDQVRELTETLGKTAQQGGYKVVVIEPAEAMNANAANALLKSLEEPAPQTLIVLVSHNPSSVLPTIRSRCQMRLLPMPRTEQVLHWLSPLLAGHSVEPAVLLTAARGAPLTALALLQGDALEEREQWLLQLGRLSLGQLSPLDLAAQWQNADVSALLEWLLSLMHSLARWRVGYDDPLINGTSAEFRARLETVSSSLLHRYLEKLLLTRRQWLSGSNPNKQLLLEELLLDWGALLRAGSNRSVASGH